MEEKVMMLIDEAEAIWHISLYHSSVQINGWSVAYRLAAISNELYGMDYELKKDIPDIVEYVCSYTDYDSYHEGLFFISGYCREEND